LALLTLHNILASNLNLPQGQLQEAIAAYQQAINLDRSNANIYFNLAIALQKQGQVEPAIAGYRQALQLNPQNAPAYNNMASLLAIQGQASESTNFRF